MQNAVHHNDVYSVRSKSVSTNICDFMKKTPKSRKFIQLHPEEMELLEKYASHYFIDPSSAIRVAIAITLRKSPNVELQDIPSQISHKTYQQTNISLYKEQIEAIVSFQKRNNISNFNTAARVAFLKGISLERKSGNF